MNNDNDKRGFWQSLKDKGYYIALILCAIAIGVSGYVYYRSNQDEPSANLAQEVTTPSQTSKATRPAGASVEDNDLVPAIGTTPTTPTVDSTEPSSEETTGNKPTKTMWPVEGQTAAAYAADHLAYNVTTRDWRVHTGVDLTAEEGTQVMAAADGTVYTVYDDDLMGTTVIIRHTGGYMTCYSSLSEELAVSAGDTVSCGDVIGAVGQTALTEKALGPHVHFSVTYNDQGMDPAEFVE